MKISLITLLTSIGLGFPIVSSAQTSTAAGCTSKECTSFDWSREDYWLEPVCKALNKTLTDGATVKNKEIKCSYDKKSFDAGLAAELKKGVTKQRKFDTQVLCLGVVGKMLIPSGFAETAVITDKRYKDEVLKKVNQIVCMYDTKAKEPSLTLTNGTLTIHQTMEGENSNYNWISEGVISRMFSSYDVISKENDHSFPH